METTNTEYIHPFEKAGLGKAPFRCVGVEAKVGPINLGGGMTCGAPGQPMGSCDYCGTGIRDCYIIRSADGKVFEVGCDCVRKTTTKGTRVLREVEQAAKKARDKATDERIQRAYDALWSNLAISIALGERGAGYALFCQRNAGRSGKLRCAKMIEKALA